MNRILGYSLMGVGTSAFFFHELPRNSKNCQRIVFCTELFYTDRWSIFYAKHQLQERQTQNTGNDRLAKIDQLKHIGEKVKVTPNNSEIKTITHQQEIIPNLLPGKTEILEVLYDSNRNYKTEEIQQTYMIFYKQYRGRIYKFVRKATSQSADVVRRFIDRQNGIDLNIDPRDPTKYYFKLPYG